MSLPLNLNVGKTKLKTEAPPNPLKRGSCSLLLMKCFQFYLFCFVPAREARSLHFCAASPNLKILTTNLNILKYYTNNTKMSMSMQLTDLKSKISFLKFLHL